MSKDVLIVGSDGVEVIVPKQLVACSLVLRRQSILGPITMSYTGKELSSAIATTWNVSWQEAPANGP